MIQMNIFGERSFLVESERWCSVTSPKEKKIHLEGYKIPKLSIEKIMLNQKNINSLSCSFLFPNYVNQIWIELKTIFYSDVHVFLNLSIILYSCYKIQFKIKGLSKNQLC